VYFYPCPGVGGKGRKNGMFVPKKNDRWGRGKKHEEITKGGTGEEKKKRKREPTKSANPPV